MINELVNRITSHSGPGHSCGIHTVNEMRIKELSHKVRVSRITVCQPQCLANSGARRGNSTSSNVTREHLPNYTWVC
jgi:acyl-CoA reductase-like NAD-dependent aldehyde dehydrogenase